MNGQAARKSGHFCRGGGFCRLLSNKDKRLRRPSGRARLPLKYEHLIGETYKFLIFKKEAIPLGTTSLKRNFSSSLFDSPIGITDFEGVI
ncbi:hypothetical protein [Paenibacillus sp. MBLB4367]|uniref:hypothetical protein n=1 Tax=Paenibacillus sp. MBLB4367 TaxID=3384767 RepID=UPI00390836F6